MINKGKMKRLILVAAGVLLVWFFGGKSIGGIMILSVLWIGMGWKDSELGEKLYKTKNLRSIRNPLYANGYFRKRNGRDRLWFLEDLKGLALCQLYSYFGASMVFFYGLWLTCSGAKIELAYAALVIGLVVQRIIDTQAIKHYKRLLEVFTVGSLKRKTLWQFASLENVVYFPRNGICNYNNIPEDVKTSLKNEGYRHTGNTYLDKIGAVTLFERRLQKSVEIFALIEKEASTYLLNRYIERAKTLILERDTKKQKAKETKYISLLIITEDMAEVIGQFLGPFKQERECFFLMGAVSVSTKEFCMSGLHTTFGVPQYRRMRRDMLKVLGRPQSREVDLVARMLMEASPREKK